MLYKFKVIKRGTAIKVIGLQNNVKFFETPCTVVPAYLTHLGTGRV